MPFGIGSFCSWEKRDVNDRKQHPGGELSVDGPMEAAP